MTELSGNKIVLNESINNLKTKWLLIGLQKAYTRRYEWYYPWSLVFYYYVEHERYDLDTDDLEHVTFYQDKEDGTFYFVPADSQITQMMKSGEKEQMFVFEISETNPRRVITSPPDSVPYCIYSTNVADIRDRLIELGTAEMDFPDTETIERWGWTDNTLTENEYMRAVTNMIHGTLIKEEQYGNYEIYIGEYFMTDDVGTHAEEFGEVAVSISAAVVCLDNGYGYHCRFVASDLLTDGSVKIYYNLPDGLNSWDEYIKKAMESRRLVITLEVKPDEEVEIPQNPYSFLMIPVLDYAVGEVIYGKDVKHSD